MLVIRYCVWNFYDIKFVVTALSAFVTSCRWVDSTGREESLAADKVRAVRVDRQDGTSINRECRTQSCDLQAV